MSAGRARRSPGWYQDPDDPTRVRHWNGRGWSGRRRPRPAWHVLANELAPDPKWVSPGGINGARQRELLGDAGELGGRDQRGAGRRARRPRGLDGPPFPDPTGGLRGGDPHLEDPLGGTAFERRFGNGEPAGDWRLPSQPYRSDRYRSSWAAAAAFGLENRWNARSMGAAAHIIGGAGRPTYGSGVTPVGPVPYVGWRRNRVPLVIVVGLTLFAVVALLVNLGTTARGRFSAVSVDATFIGQANVACATALGSGRLGSKTVMTAGTSTGTPSGGAATTAGQPAGAGVGVGALSSSQLERLTNLETRLGALHTTSAAALGVQGWLTDWQRYLGDERALAKADARHDDVVAEEDAAKARTAADSADLFAADNGLSACAIDASSRSGLEPVP